MIRATLDRLYLWSGYVAAFFLAAIAVSVVVQVIGRLLGLGIDSTKVSGFCLASSSFFALAHTFRKGSHVRVTLIAHRFTGARRRVIEAWCCGAACVIVGYVAYYVVLMDLQSYRFNELTTGILALPFWIPQLGMAIGLVLLEVALIDEIIAILRGAEPSYEVNQETALD